MNDYPQLCVWMSDFGEVRLSAKFVAEAAARWPDIRCTRIPRWVGKVRDAMGSLMSHAWTNNYRITSLKSITALECHGLPA